MNVQRAYVERVLAAVAGSGNVILELMNEPRIARPTTQHPGQRPGDHGRLAEHASPAGSVDWPAAPGASPRPLISANASYPINGVLPPSPPATPPSDVDFWAAAGSLTRYGQLDLVSYHGLTGVGRACRRVCGGSRRSRSTWRRSRARIARHKSAACLRRR